MRDSVRFAIVLFVLGSPAVAARAQDTGPGARIARFVDPQTVAVVRIDLERLELPGAEALFRDLPLGEPERGVVQALLQRVGEAIASWKQLGAREAFYVLSLADLPQGGGGFLVLPGVRGPAGDEPHESLDQFGECEVIAGALVCAQRDVLARLKRQTDGRTLPAAAFEAIADFPVQLVITPSDDHRRVLRELSPELPAEWGGLSGRTLADGAVWAALGVRLAEQPGARIVVQSQDAASAAALQQALKGALEAAGRQEPVRQFVPDVDRSIRALTPAVEDDRLVLGLSIEDPPVRAALALLPGVAAQARQSAEWHESRDNLKQLGIAMHSFHDAWGGFPPAASYDAAGKPLLSWRVYLLPFVDGGDLYKQFRLDEPWDSEHNKRLIEKMPPVFGSPGVPTEEGRTTYLAPIGESTAFTGGKAGIPISAITDGTSITILLIEVPADKAVVWTKPEDWPVDLQAPRKGLFPEGRETLPALFGDGSVRAISNAIDAKTLREIFTRNGGEPIGDIP